MEGRSANNAKDPAEDTADTTDTTDADLLEVLSNDHTTTANLEQGVPAEAHTLAPAASIEPARPPRYPTPPETDSARAALDLFVERFPLGNPGAPLPGAHQGSPIYQSSQAAFGASTWAPFHSQCDWEIAHWAKMRGPSSSAMEELLAIPEVRTCRLAAIGFLTDRQRWSIDSDCHSAPQKS
jgi:hypothetical protein